MDKTKITVVGAGTMGAGIAQRASQSGFLVYLVDVEDEFIKRGFEGIEKTLKKGIELGKVTEEQSKRVIENIKGTTDLMEAVSQTTMVIEAIFEDAEVKKMKLVPMVNICSLTFGIIRIPSVLDKVLLILALQHIIYPVSLVFLAYDRPAEH